MIRSSIIRKIVIEEFENIKRDDNPIVQSDLDEEELGGGYSVEFNAMPENDFMKESFDHIIKSEVRNYLLKENVVGDMAEATLNNAVQWVVDAVVQYGITTAGFAAAVPTAGASAGGGVATGAAAKTVIDSAIAMKYVSSAISIFEFLTNNFKQLESVFKHASKLPDYVDDLDKFYKENTKMVQKAFNMFGKSGKLKAQSVLEKLEKAINDALVKLSVIVSKIVSPVIPDATTAATVREIITTVGIGLTSKCFTVLKGIRSALGSYSDFFFKSEKIMPYIKMAIPATIEIFNAVADKTENSSLNIGDYAVAGVAVAKKSAQIVAPKVLRSIASYIKNEQANIISVVEKIVEIVIPTFISLTATFQALASGDVNIAVPGDDDADVDNKNSDGPGDVPPAVASQTTPAPAPTNVPNIAEMKKEIGKLNKRLQVLNERKSRRRRLHYA